MSAKNKKNVERRMQERLRNKEQNKAKRKEALARRAEFDAKWAQASGG